MCTASHVSARPARRYLRGPPGTAAAARRQPWTRPVERQRTHPCSHPGSRRPQGPGGTGAPSRWRRPVLGPV